MKKQPDTTPPRGTAMNPRCQVCGEPMPAGEEMFKLHGYSGPCPKPPLPRIEQTRPRMKKQPTSKPRYLTVKEAQARVKARTGRRLPRSTAYRLVKTDLLGGKLGGKVLISASILETYLDTLDI